MIMRRVVLSLSAIALLALAIVLVFSHLATRATPSNVNLLAENEQEFALTTSDEVRISASFFPAKQMDAPIILLLHGNGASRSQFGGHVGWLNEAGLSAMAIDFRGHGESDEHPKSFGLLEARDVLSAIEWIKANHPSSKVGVIGVSLGGAAALLNDSTSKDVDALILKAVYPDFDRAVRNRVRVHGGGFLSSALTPLLTNQSRLRFGHWPEEISPLAAASDYQGSVLVIGGTDDVYTPSQESEALAEAFPNKHWLWLIAGLGHDQISDLDDPVYQKRVIGFFKEQLTN